MMDDANVRMQALLQANAEKFRELEAFADEKAEENAVLIEKFYKNHKLLKGKINEQLHKRRHIS